MAKKPSNNKKKGGQRLGKSGSKGRKIDDKSKKSKKKTETVYYPAIIPKPEEEMSEEEISYKDRLLAIEVEKLAAKGLTNDQIIQELRISRWTFYKKLKEQPYFTYALFKHRHIAIQNVESALYKRSVGYTVLEKTIEAKPVVSIDEAGNLLKNWQLIDSKIIEKDIPPDVKAIELFLINRDSANWKKKVEPEQKQIADMSQMTFKLKKRAEL